MKKMVILIFMLLFISSQSDACIGRIINISILGTENEHMIAELVSVMINERTGTTVNIKVYDSLDKLYTAVKKEEFTILIENTDRAMIMLNMPVVEDHMKAYNILKEEFRNNLNLTWLKPFGSLPDSSGNNVHFYSPVISRDVLINFPALPRVINKLTGVLDDKFFSDVLKSIKAGQKPGKVVRRFLKKKKLI